MLPRNIFLGLIAVVLIGASMCAYGLEPYKPNTDYQRQGDFRATGAAANIDRRTEVFEVTDRSNTYTILADRATVQLNNGKFGTIRDLKDNAQVRVMGEQLSVRTVLASAVIVLNDSGSFIDSGTHGYRPNDPVETDGSVTRVSAQVNEIDIRTRNGSYVVAVRPGTVIRRYIYVTDINDVNEGDDITLTGTVDREGKIVADRIQVSASNSGERGKYPVGKGYRPPSAAAMADDREDSIEGLVTYPTSAFDRSLGLDTRFGERKVDVPKDAKVLIDGEAGSVHSFVKGDKLRATGVWSGSTLVATQIETITRLSAAVRVEETTPAPEPPPAAEPTAAEPPTVAPEPAPVEPPATAPEPPPAPAPRPNTFTGRIVEIDYAKFELTVDFAMLDNKIDAQTASITRKGSTRRFSELKKGDKVEVKGDWTGDVLKATIVDVVE